MRIKIRTSFRWLPALIVLSAIAFPLLAVQPVYATGEQYGYDAPGDPANLPSAIIVSGGSNNIPPQRLNREPNTSNYTGTIVTSTEAQGGRCSYNVTIDVDDDNISGGTIGPIILNGQASPNVTAFCADKRIGPAGRITIAAVTTAPPTAVCTAPYVAEGGVCVADVGPTGLCPAPGELVQQPDGTSRCEAASGSNTPGGGVIEDEPDNCPIAEGTEFRWAMCPVFDLMGGLTNTLDFFINEYLTTGNKIFDEQEAGYKAGWETFRNFGIGLVVIAGLVMLVSEALGLAIIDAYTVRKVLPRLLIAIIGISLSWELCKVLITIFDDLGQAMGSVIYTSFNITDGVEVWAVIVGQLLIGGAATAAGLLLTGAGVLSLIGTLLMAMLVAAVVLILRQAIIIAAVLLAPLAIAAYILPNTSKFASFWWDTFIRMLMLYPIATGIIALCKVLGRITMTSPNDALGGFGTIIAVVTGMLFFFAGYALLPLAFRLTGGLVATLGGIANDRSRGFFDKQKKKRSELVAGSKAEMAAGNRFKGNNAIASGLNSFTRGTAAASKAGLNPMRMKARTQAVLSERRFNEAAEMMDKSPEFAAIADNDDLLEAGRRNSNDAGTRQYLEGKGYQGANLEQAVASVRRARGAGSTEAFNAAATMQIAGTGTGFKNGGGEMLEAINQTAGNDRAMANRMLGTMRSKAGQARRFDLNGGGFGDSSKIMESMHTGSSVGTIKTLNDASAATDKVAATAQMDRMAMRGQSGGNIANMKASTVERMAPVMHSELKAVADTGNIVNFQRELAAMAGRYDAMASVSPESAEAMAEHVFSRDLGGKTIQQHIEDNRNNPEFLAMRREYSAASRGGGTPTGARADAVRAGVEGQINPQP